MQGRLEGVSFSGNQYDLEWDCDLQGLQNPYKSQLPVLFTFYLNFLVAAMQVNLRCSESMLDFSRVGMMEEDIPNVPGRGTSPPHGYLRSQILALCVMIKGLLDRDQEIAMAFIKALAVQHQKRTMERRNIRKKINRMLLRVTAITRELHNLNSHPGDWIELGISKFARIPDCMMSNLDLAGQGVQVFCKSRRVS